MLMSRQAFKAELSLLIVETFLPAICSDLTKRIRSSVVIIATRRFAPPIATKVSANCLIVTFLAFDSILSSPLRAAAFLILM